MKHRSWDEPAVRRSRIRGSLLGGAIGDALGNPVEFLSLDAIRSTYGAAGVTGLVPDAEGVTGRVTDDTQMTLFTAEGLLIGHARSKAAGSPVDETALVHEAYLRWLDTQDHPAPPPADGARHRYGWLREETWLYARRAPGNACLSGLRSAHVPRGDGRPDGTPGPVNPDSKGCGTVMRSAPFGFTGLAPARAFELAAACARITHGHPTGYYAAGAFAALVGHLVQGESLEAAVLRTLHLLSHYQGHQQTTAALRAALELAGDGEATAEKVESLGEGWVAEEALGIAVYAALAPTRPQVFHVDQDGRHSHPDPPRTPVEAALLLSVNHSGDSDSTGSLCGNLLGALHGDVRLPHAWLSQVEGRAVIAALADDLAAEADPAGQHPWSY